MTDKAIHVLKSWPQYFDPMLAGNKTFDVRIDDRNFAQGDVIVLRRFDPERSEFTGPFSMYRISFVMKDEAFVKPGTAILGLHRMQYSDRVAALTALEKTGGYPFMPDDRDATRGAFRC